MDKKLYRSRKNYMVSGVIGGFGEFTGIDVSTLRIIYALLAIFSGGMPILIYIIFALIMPRAPRDEEFDADVIDMKKEWQINCRSFY